MLGVAVVALLGSTPAAAATWTVPTDHPSLQQAVDAAAEGDQIVLEAGAHCGATLRRRVAIVGKPGAVIVGCARGPKLFGDLRVGVLIDGAGERHRASGSLITGVTFDGAEVSDGDVRPLAFGVWASFADDVVVTRNQFLGTVQAVTNTGGDGWTITHNVIRDLTLFTCPGRCGGGAGIVVQLPREDRALPGGSLNPANRPDRNTIADNDIQARIPADFDVFAVAGVLVLAADQTVVFGNQLSVRAPTRAQHPVAAGVLVDNRRVTDEQPAVPGARETVVEENDGSASDAAVQVRGSAGVNTEGLRIERNRGTVTVEETELPQP